MKKSLLIILLFVFQLSITVSAYNRPITIYELGQATGIASSPSLGEQGMKKTENEKLREKYGLDEVSPSSNTSKPIQTLDLKKTVIICISGVVLLFVINAFAQKNHTKKSFSKLRHLLSVAVLPVCYIVVYLWFTLMYRCAIIAYRWLDTLSTLGVILAVVFLGSITLALLFAPIKYGALLTIQCSEAIAPSKHGERYRTFSIILLLLTVVSFLLSLRLMGTLNLACIFVAIYCIQLFFFSKGIETN